MQPLCHNSLLCQLLFHLTESKNQGLKQESPSYPKPQALGFTGQSHETLTSVPAHPSVHDAQKTGWTLSSQSVA